MKCNGHAGKQERGGGDGGRKGLSVRGRNKVYVL
jgi:hypothetical protein